MADTMDIQLTLEDFKEMAPEALLGVYDALRQSRRDIKRERDTIREQIDEARNERARVEQIARKLVEDVRRRDAHLATVAMVMIERGLLHSGQMGGENVG